MSQVYVDLNYFPRAWQRECHASRKRFTVLALHRRAGKTELAIMELLDHALQFKQDLGMFFYVAPFLKQAKAIAWSRLKQRIEPMRQHGVVDGRSGNNKYLNKRSEIWFEMREWLKLGASIPNSTDLKQDLAAPIYWYDSTGRVQLEPKDDIKKRGLPSPDLGDALAVTFAHPVAKLSELDLIKRNSKEYREREYDPFEKMR